MLAFGSLFTQLAILWAFIASTWWLWAPPALGLAGWKLWKFYLKVRYAKNLEWMTLEVRIPREIAKTPEAMEQVFAGLQTMYYEFDPWEKYWLGLQHDYLAFEMASIGGETRFYLRLPVFYKNLLEAQIYAQYPEVEIAEVEDYMARLPPSAPNEEWNLFGLEFNLEKPDGYPIRTYREYLSLSAGMEEFEKVDPFASMVELFGKIGPGEHMGYHLILRPVQGDKWVKDGQALVDKLIGKKTVPKKGKLSKALEPIEPLTTGWGEPLKPIFGLPAGEAAPAKREEPFGSSMMLHLSPGARDVVAAIERNITKPGFEVVVRFIYLARRDVYSLSHLASFIGALKTYNTHTLNGFKLNGASMASAVAWWLPEFATRKKKQHTMSLYYHYYRMRKPLTDTWSLKSKPIVLNTEELATVYHYPGATAKAPLLPRIETKRSEPPATLPVG